MSAFHNATEGFSGNCHAVQDDEKLLASFGVKKLQAELGLEYPIDESLFKYNNFKWGKNNKSRDFLRLIGVDANVLDESKEKITPVELVPVSYSLHLYQNWVRKSINEFLINDHRSRVIVHMPTGAGKTRTMLESVCDYYRQLMDSKKTVVWLAHSEELCDQAVSSFSQLWSKLGSEEANVVRLWGGSKPVGVVVDKPTFVVAGFKTATNLTKTNDSDRYELFSDIRRSCALLIVDEAHQSVAPTYKDAIELFTNRSTKIIGLTATPGRHHVGQDEHETMKLARFYDNNKINILDDGGGELEDPISFLTDKGVLSTVEYFQVDSGIDIELTNSEVKQMERYLDIPSSVLKKLGSDVNRTNLIVTQAMKLAVEKNFSTIVFAPSKDSAIDISTIITMKGVEARVITSDTPKFQRKNDITRFKNGKIPILVNFGVLTTGFDAPNIKAVIIARPTTSVVLYSQMIGRGLRGPLMGGESECYLIDVKDNLANMPKSNDAFVYFNKFYEY